jgi:hypothetical protein
MYRIRIGSFGLEHAGYIDGGLCKKALKVEAQTARKRLQLDFRQFFGHNGFVLDNLEISRVSNHPATPLPSCQLFYPKVFSREF